MHVEYDAGDNSYDEMSRSSEALDKNNPLFKNLDNFIQEKHNSKCSDITQNNNIPNLKDVTNVFSTSNKSTEFEASENNEDIAKAACFQNKEKSDKDKKKEKSIKLLVKKGSIINILKII